MRRFTGEGLMKSVLEPQRHLASAAGRRRRCLCKRDREFLFIALIVYECCNPPPHVLFIDFAFGADRSARVVILFSVWAQCEQVLILGEKLAYITLVMK